MIKQYENSNKVLIKLINGKAEKENVSYVIEQNT